MSVDDSGRTRTVAVLALLLAVAAVVVLGGLALGAMDSGSDERTGEEILSDVQETYDSADSVSSDGVVTVEALGRTTQFEVSAAAAGDDQLRTNVSKNGLSVVTGVDNGTVWRYDSVTGLTGVIDSNGNTVTASLRGGTETPPRPGLSVLPGDISLDTELSTVRAALDGELPEDLDERLDDLPENATVGDVLANDSLAADIDSGALAGDTGDLPGGFEDFEFPANLSEYELPEKFEDFEFPANLSEYELPEKFEDFEFPGNLSEYELPAEWTADTPPEGWNRSDLREQFNRSLTGGFDSSAVTVERNGTTTVDGTEAHELLISHPETEVETRLWTDTESDVVLRQETKAPGVTVTVDVRETRFGVSPAASTFEPPGATQVASLSLSTAATPGTLESTAPFGVAAPGDDWRFEQGVTLAGEAPPLTAATGLDAGTVTAAAYASEGTTLVVGQSGDAIDLDRLPALGTETETVGDREVWLVTTPYASAGVFVEDGTTVVVAGDLSGSELRTVIAGINL
jgi:outer membrane lipoprotein-sorting protein